MCFVHTRSEPRARLVAIEVRSLVYPHGRGARARFRARFRSAPHRAALALVRACLVASVPVDGAAFLPDTPRWLRR
jgi:hypothetical protein